MFQIVDEPINAELLSNKVRRGDYGAVVNFIGTVRGHSQGRKVLYLEYEAYREMATKKLRQIGEEIDARWNLEDIAIYHRVGRLEAGEISLVVAVGAPHRKDAFEACRYAVDRLKQIVPIWKKEVFENGEVWEEEATTSPSPEL